jgi:bifunctional UDP-N-acetylglucosamine pyrophosphorylase/glucosamine-1-phosphate N-acetyltransferase
VLLVHGDEPLIEPEVYRSMLELQHETGASVVLLTARVDDTRGFGRVIRNQEGDPIGLLQETDLSPDQRSIDEVNLGAYVFDACFLREHLARLQSHPPKNEYYLTDLIALAVEEGRPGAVAAFTIGGGSDILGINDLVQLEQATRTIYRRTNRLLMESGVTIVDSASTFVDEEVQIEPDTVIYPFTIISGRTTIGRASQIGPGSRILSSQIGEGCQVVWSMVEESEVGDGVTIGPYAHLRAGARVGAGAEIGNYAEIKKSTVGAGTRMHHFSYLGDAQVGADVNIGAGTITCNFDGVAKHRTVIEEGAFIGSDTMLRAPVTVGKKAVTGAGSVVLKDVPAGSIVAGAPARIIREAPQDEPVESERCESEAQTRRGASWGN